MGFADHVAERSTGALRTLGVAEPDDAYVVSLFVYDEEDDPWRPTVTIDINTESQVAFAVTAPESQRPHIHWRPSDEAEARWNFAFWRQQAISVIADSHVDPHGAALREQWLRGLGLWLDEPDADEWERQGVTRAFVDMLVHVARELHRSGFIAETFGRSIPIVIHELEYYPEIAEQTKRANPEGLAAPFVSWVGNPS